ncbi:DUF6191 domain-containing protein [Streptomyces sp. NPDC058371]|uniref:DUF6191 domain-containing protein n=1 Tax=Streptomyces sp. NPDC058371 TaxID=3346463 RepID=UPI0036620BB3
MFNMFEELFAPGRKHTNDERKRLELTRVDLNDGDPGRGPIDLTSGKVVVRRPTQEQAAAEDEDPATPEAGAADEALATASEADIEDEDPAAASEAGAEGRPDQA